MKIKVTSGIVVNDEFYLKNLCNSNIPKLCSLASMNEFFLINKIPLSGVPSGDLNVYLKTGCVGNLTLLNNDLTNFTTSSLIENKEYEVLPICISGILFGQVTN